MPMMRCTVCGGITPYDSVYFKCVMCRERDRRNVSNSVSEIPGRITKTETHTVLKEAAMELQEQSMGFEVGPPPKHQDTIIAGLKAANYTLSQEIEKLKTQLIEHETFDGIVCDANHWRRTQTIVKILQAATFFLGVLVVILSISVVSLIVFR